MCNQIFFNNDQLELQMFSENIKEFHKKIKDKPIYIVLELIKIELELINLTDFIKGRDEK